MKDIELENKEFDEEDDAVVTLLSENGEEIDFVEIAGIAYEGAFYAIMQPVELLEGMDDNEALVFKFVKGKNGADRFQIELDERVIDAVFEEYDKLYDQAVNDAGDGNED